MEGGYEQMGAHCRLLSLPDIVFRHNENTGQANLIQLGQEWTVPQLSVMIIYNSTW